MTIHKKYLLKHVLMSCIGLTILYAGFSHFYSRMEILNRLFNPPVLDQDTCSFGSLGSDVYLALLAEAKRNSMKFEYRSVETKEAPTALFGRYFKKEDDLDFLKPYIETQIFEHVKNSDILEFRLAVAHAFMRAHWAVSDERVINKTFIYSGMPAHYNSDLFLIDNVYLIDPIVMNYAYYNADQKARFFLGYLLKPYHAKFSPVSLPALYDGSLTILSRYQFLDQRTRAGFDPLMQLPKDTYGYFAYLKIITNEIPNWPRKSKDFETVSTRQEHDEFCNSMGKNNQSEKYRVWSQLNHLGQ